MTAADYRRTGGHAMTRIWFQWIAPWLLGLAIGAALVLACLWAYGWWA